MNPKAVGPSRQWEVLERTAPQKKKKETDPLTRIKVRGKKRGSPHKKRKHSTQSNNGFQLPIINIRIQYPFTFEQQLGFIRKKSVGTPF